MQDRYLEEGCTCSASPTNELTFRRHSLLYLVHSTTVAWPPWGWMCDFAYFLQPHPQSLVKVINTAATFCYHWSDLLCTLRGITPQGSHISMNALAVICARRFSYSRQSVTHSICYQAAYPAWKTSLDDVFFGCILRLHRQISWNRFSIRRWLIWVDVIPEWWSIDSST